MKPCAIVCHQTLFLLAQLVDDKEYGELARAAILNGMFVPERTYIRRCLESPKFIDMAFHFSLRLGTPLESTTWRYEYAKKCYALDHHIFTYLQRYCKEGPMGRRFLLSANRDQVLLLWLIRDNKLTTKEKMESFLEYVEYSLKDQYTGKRFYQNTNIYIGGE